MAAEERKKAKRREHLNSFILEEDGSYGYHGDSYRYCSALMSRKSLLARLWAAGILAGCAVVLAGCIPAPGMDNCFYVILPYVGEVAFTASLLWAVVRLSTAGDPLRDYVYRATVEKIPSRAAAAMGFAGAGTVGAAIFLILNGSDGSAAWVLLFFILKMIVIMCTYMIKSFTMRSKWKKESGWPTE